MPAVISPAPKHWSSRWRRLPSSSIARSTRYTAKKGDTLVTVADRFNVSVDELRGWNHLKGTTLTPGHTLYVSEPARVASPRGHHSGKGASHSSAKVPDKVFALAGPQRLRLIDFWESARRPVLRRERNSILPGRDAVLACVHWRHVSCCCYNPRAGNRRRNVARARKYRTTRDQLFGAPEGTTCRTNTNFTRLATASRNPRLDEDDDDFHEDDEEEEVSISLSSDDDDIEDDDLHEEEPVVIVVVEQPAPPAPIKAPPKKAATKHRRRKQRPRKRRRKKQRRRNRPPRRSRQSRRPRPRRPLGKLLQRKSPLRKLPQKRFRPRRPQRSRPPRRAVKALSAAARPRRNPRSRRRRVPAPKNQSSEVLLWRLKRQQRRQPRRQ